MRQGLINIPLLFLMNSLFGIDGIVWTQLISDIITAVISFAVYKYSYNKLVTNAVVLKEV
jgi:multidrug efflux pump